MGNYTYQGAPPPASLHANLAFQDHHSQFQYNSSQIDFFAGTFGYQGFHSASSNAPPDFSAPPFFFHQGQSSHNFSDIPENQLPTAFTAQPTSGNGSWIVNTGAPHHMSPDSLS